MKRVLGVLILLIGLAGFVGGACALATWDGTGSEIESHNRMLCASAMREYRIEQIPDATFYVEGLRLLGDRVITLRRTLLTAHYYAPSRRVAAPQLAALANVDGGYPIVNTQHGSLGRAFSESTGCETDPRGAARFCC